MIDGCPVKRAGTPDKVGTVAALLMGGAGAFIPGSDVLMDRGVTSSYWFGEPARNEVPRKRIGMTTWFITGAAPATATISPRRCDCGGGAVIAARDIGAVEELAAAYPAHTLPLALDVTAHGQIRQALQQAEARFGAVDVLVNPATACAPPSRKTRPGCSRPTSSGQLR